MVLNPSCLRIVQKLDAQEVRLLTDAIFESVSTSFGVEGEAVASLALINEIKCCDRPPRQGQSG